MLISNILIIVDKSNADRNTLHEIAAAVADTGATVLEVDEDRFIIEAAAPAHVVATISAMEGVSYVRSVFSYVSELPEPDAV